MPSIDSELPRHQSADPATSAHVDDVDFPPVSKDHIVNCSYDQWFPKYDHPLRCDPSKDIHSTCAVLC